MGIFRYNTFERSIQNLRHQRGRNGAPGGDPGTVQHAPAVHGRGDVRGLWLDPPAPRPAARGGGRKPKLKAGRTNGDVPLSRRALGNLGDFPRSSIRPSAADPTATGRGSERAHRDRNENITESPSRSGTLGHSPVRSGAATDLTLYRTFRAGPARGRRGSKIGVVSSFLPSPVRGGDRAAPAESAGSAVGPPGGNVDRASRGGTEPGRFPLRRTAQSSEPKPPLSALRCDRPTYLKEYARGTMQFCTRVTFDS